MTLTAEERQAILDYIETLEGIYQSQFDREPLRTACEWQALEKIQLGAHNSFDVTTA